MAGGGVGMGMTAGGGGGVGMAAGGGGDAVSAAVAGLQPVARRRAQPWTPAEDSQLEGLVRLTQKR